jgi:hypothetical protein
MANWHPDFNIAKVKECFTVDTDFTTFPLVIPPRSPYYSSTIIFTTLNTTQSLYFDSLFRRAASTTEGFPEEASQVMQFEENVCP